MVKLIDSLAVKYFENEKFDENERHVFSELRYIAATIYLHTECIKFKTLLDAVVCANRDCMPQLVENSKETDLVFASKTIRYTPSQYSITVLPENYFKKEKANA